MANLAEGKISHLNPEPKSTNTLTYSAILCMLAQFVYYAANALVSSEATTSNAIRLCTSPKDPDCTDVVIK